MCDSKAAVSKIWDQHLSMTYPRNCRGLEVEGIDLVLLAADVAGCVSQFLKSADGEDFRKRYADFPLSTSAPDLPPATFLLMNLLDKTKLVKAHLQRYDLEYFSTVEEMCSLMLQAVNQRGTARQCQC